VGAKARIETRQAIVETARMLLRRYGPDKLTVVDIARALRMSHANVYRFFKTKSEILDAITDEWLAKLEAFVEEIAGRRMSAAKRIEAIVVELHCKRKRKCVEDAEVFETFRLVVAARPDVAAERRAKITAVFKRLLEEGMAAGEFRKMDSAKVSTALKDASSLFLHPFMIPTTVHEPTEQRARNVVQYILSGFLAKGPRFREQSLNGETSTIQPSTRKRRKARSARSAN